MKTETKVSSAVALYVGTAIGVGIFGIPFTVARAGFVVGMIEVFILGLLMIFITLIYGEIVLRTKENHQLIGYAQKYIGTNGKILATVAVVVSIYSALTAYTIESGVFLHALISPSFVGSEGMYSIVFLCIMATVLFFGIRSVVWVEKIMVVLLLIVMVFLIREGIGDIEISNFTNVNIRYMFLPYGVILFALAATSAVPDMRRALGDNRRNLRKSIILGGIIPILVYALFTFIVVGVSGASTTESSLLGLGAHLGKPILVMGSIFGILAMSTSFASLGLILKETYEYDFKMPRILAWLLVVSVPLIIFMLQIVSFVQILSIGGAIIGGCEGLLILSMHAKAKHMGNRKPEYTLRLSKMFRWALSALFLGGIIYEIFVVF